MAKRNKLQDDKDYAELVAVNDLKNVTTIKRIIGDILPNDIKVIAKNESQKDLIKSIKNNEITVCSGPAGTGKAQPLDSLILSENGFIKMGEVKLNDMIYTMSGELTKVIGIFPQGKKKTYKITFSDDSVTECCDEHLWLSKSARDRENKKDYKVRQLSEMINDFILVERNGRKNYSIPITQPIKFSEKEISIDSYLMGILIGDGCFTAPNIKLTSVDDEIINEFNNKLGELYTLSQVKSDIISYNIIFSNNYDSKRRLDENYPSFKNIINDYNLNNIKSNEKFIPKEYLFNSIDNRIKLLQGLMDSDGTVERKSGSLVFSTSSLKLIEDFRFLIESLGGVVNKLRIKKGKYKKDGVIKVVMDSYIYSFRLPNNIIPFKLERKLKLFKLKSKYFPVRYIKDIKYIGEKESQCIMVDSPSHTYLTNNYIVTHNTFVAIAYALRLLRTTTNRYKKIYLIKSVTTLKNEEIGYLKGPQPYYEMVITPSGYTTMGELNVGDYVITENGTKTEIKGIYEQGIKDIYRVHLKDDRYVDCCLDHLWNVRTKKLGYFTVNTKFLLEHLNKEDFYLPKIKPVEFDINHKLPIHPYMLGVLIGDGCFTSSHIRFANIDDELVIKMNRICDEIGLKLVKNNISYNIVPTSELIQRGSKEMKLTNLITNEIFTGYLKDVKKFLNYNGDSTIIGRCNRNAIFDNIKYEYTNKLSKSNNILREFLHECGLFGKKSYEKFIPNEFKITSINNRIELLRGLLDTNGTIKQNGEITYCTTSLQLANDVKDVVLSLGGSARIYRPKLVERNQMLNGGKVIQRKQMFTVYIKFHDEKYNPFFIKRKAERFKTLSDNTLKIVKIEYLNAQEKMRCISVNSSTSLYLTRDYIPTHNSLTEKIEPFMWSFYINMEKIVMKSLIDQLIAEDIIRPFPLAYMRGASLDDCIIIADEMQNVSLDNSRTLLTRIGSNCKLILLGDKNQIDLRNKTESSLEIILDLFEGVDNFGVIRMSEEDTNVRNPLIGAIEDKFKEYYETKLLLENSTGKTNNEYDKTRKNGRY